MPTFPSAPEMYPPLSERWRLYCHTCKAIRPAADWVAAPGDMPIVTCRVCHQERVVPEGYRW